MFWEEGEIASLTDGWLHLVRWRNRACYYKGKFKYTWKYVYGAKKSKLLPKFIGYA